MISTRFCVFDWTICRPNDESSVTTTFSASSLPLRKFPMPSSYKKTIASSCSQRRRIPFTTHSTQLYDTVLKAMYLANFSTPPTATVFSNTYMTIPRVAKKSIRSHQRALRRRNRPFYLPQNINSVVCCSTNTTVYSPKTQPCLSNTPNTYSNIRVKSWRRVERNRKLCVRTSVFPKHFPRNCLIRILLPAR